MRTLLRRIGAGRTLYRAWHAPLGRLSQAVKDGGPIEQWRTQRGRLAMEAAASSLTPLPSSTLTAPLELHVLSGRRFWYQSVFCLWTFARQANRAIHPIVYDDGSLSADLRRAILHLFPLATLVTADDIRERLDRVLPVARYPTLRARRLSYPNLRKLVDVHAGLSGWKLVIDSDLLFFRRPRFLIDWLEAPSQPLHAVDCETSYGYSRGLMNQLARAEVADRVNVGLTGLSSQALDWDQLEHWSRTLIDREGMHYYLEQAVVAMLVAGRSCSIAPAAEYVTLPRLPEAAQCEAVMHHYVAESKRWYFRDNWRRAAAAPQAG